MSPNSQLILVNGKTAKHVDITGILHIEGEIKNTGSLTANGVSMIAPFTIMQIKHWEAKPQVQIQSIF
jgi:hypothetical protein